MPKVLVLVFGDEESSALTDAVASGAKGVRFTEVDVRSANKTSRGHKSLDAERGLSDYDGVVLVSTGSELAPGANVANVPSANVTNMVIGVVESNRALLDLAVRSGGILVTQWDSADGADTRGSVDRARALGARVAKVAGWVRHGLGHEAEHAAPHQAANQANTQADHHHSHDHEHNHEHGHGHHH